MIELRRNDPAQNMRRFYRLDIQPDLFGGFLLLNNGGASARTAISRWRRD
jgi:predicted DNA-binding WGR domain protein